MVFNLVESLHLVEDVVFKDGVELVLKRGEHGDLLETVHSIILEGLTKLNSL